jgi:phage shock protein PspC (stress-responsive transcriptional regulator)
MIAGVCGGLAERLGISVGAVRLAFVIGTLIPVVPGPVVYVILWLSLPNEDAAAAS